MPCVTEPYPCKGCGYVTCCCDSIRLNEVTDLLCKQCRHLETEFENANELIHEEVKGWWKRHKKADERKLKKEQEEKQRTIDYKKKQIQELQQEINQLSK